MQYYSEKFETSLKNSYIKQKKIFERGQIAVPDNLKIAWDFIDNLFNLEIDEKKKIRNYKTGFYSLLIELILLMKPTCEADRIEILYTYFELLGYDRNAIIVKEMIEQYTFIIDRNRKENQLSMMGLFYS